MPKSNLEDSQNVSISLLIRENRALMKETPADPSNPKDIKKRIDAYFLECEKLGSIPTIQRLALKLGVDFATFKTWFDPKTNGVAMGTIDLLNRARDTISSVMTDLSLSGELNLTGYTFHAQNYLGLSKDGKKGSAATKETKPQTGKLPKKNLEELKNQL